MARLVFLGTPEAAVAPLRTLVSAGHDVALVVSRADKRRGRGSGLVPSPVKSAALDLGLAVTDDLAACHAVGAELGVVVAYGRIIPVAMLDRLPMVNLHFSLLPRWRGAAPVERALLEGDAETGVCLMAVEAVSTRVRSTPRRPPPSTPRRPSTNSGADWWNRMSDAGGAPGRRDGPACRYPGTRPAIRRTPRRWPPPSSNWTGRNRRRRCGAPSDSAGPGRRSVAGGCGYSRLGRPRPRRVLDPGELSGTVVGAGAAAARAEDPAARRANGPWTPPCGSTACIRHPGSGWAPDIRRRHRDVTGIGRPLLPRVAPIG